MSELDPRSSLTARLATHIERACTIAAWWSIPETLFLVTLFGVYALGGVALVRMGVYTPEYAFLSLRDPFFSVFGTLTGLAICQGTSALVVITMMDGVRTVRQAISVLAAFVGFGFGAATIRFTVNRTLQFLIGLIRGP